MTALQMTRRTRLHRRIVSRAFSQLTHAHLTRCLNPKARQNRLYWLTTLGTQYQRALPSQTQPATDLKVVKATNWDLYGRLCYRHRSAIVRALTRRLSPADVKRVARRHDPKLRMSANNVRDALRTLRNEGVVSAVTVRKRAHPLYELTIEGERYRTLLENAESYRRVNPHGH